MPIWFYCLGTCSINPSSSLAKPSDWPITFLLTLSQKLMTLLHLRFLNDHELVFAVGVGKILTIVTHDIRLSTSLVLELECQAEECNCLIALSDLYVKSITYSSLIHS